MSGHEPDHDDGDRAASPDHARSLEITRTMYALAQELAGSDEPYFEVHGRKLRARLHHMLLSQDPAADLGFVHDDR